MAAFPQLKGALRTRTDPSHASSCLAATTSARQHLSTFAQVSGLSRAPGRIRTRDRLLRRSVCAAGQPACSQVSRCRGLSGSDRKFPALTGRSGTQRARRPLRPELEALLGVWPPSQLAWCAGGRAGWRLSGGVAVLVAVLRFRLIGLVTGAAESVMIRACAWCDGPIPGRARRDAVCYSVRCRQARHRFLRAVGYAEAVAPGRSLRLAYADPPYPGKAYMYRDHSDYAGEVDHAGLIERLAAYDGWALSTSAAALPAVLALCLPGVRVAAWHKGERVFPAERVGTCPLLWRAPAA
jgi:hypothetical protein